MNKFSRSLVFICAGFFATNLYADLPDLDEQDVRKSVDISSFIVGSDGDVGTLLYIVDRTTGNCFATIKQGSQASGITAIKCDYLQAIPAIAKYIEVGAAK